MKAVKKQGVMDYAMLLILCSVAVILSLTVKADRHFLKFILSGLAIFYSLWGIWHHRMENSLQREIILEYMLFSVLGLILVFGLL